MKPRNGFLRYQYIISIILILPFCAVLSLVLGSCGQYDNYDTESGKQIVIQKANQFLNSGMCEQAIAVLQPVFSSGKADNEIRMTMSSAYACKAGFNFPNLIAALQSSGSSTSIWAMLVKAMYSTGTDSKATNFLSAASFVNQTATPTTSLDAVNRPKDANVYMIFMQLGVISTTISVLGAANSTTGQKTITGFGLTASNAEKCRVQAAITIIVDSLANLGTSDSGVFSTLNSTLGSYCGAGFCSNKDPNNCNVNEQTEGQAYLVAIDASWI